MHSVDVKLSNINLLFFLSNASGKFQPIDLGMIHSFKAYHRSPLAKNIINNYTRASTGY